MSIFVTVDQYRYCFLTAVIFLRILEQFCVCPNCGLPDESGQKRVRLRH